MQRSIVLCFSVVVIVYPIVKPVVMPLRCSRSVKCLHNAHGGVINIPLKYSEIN